MRPCVWAPIPSAVALALGTRRVAMDRGDDGWWTCDEELAPGTDYAFVLDGGPPRPDPRSAWQPHGVHGASRVVDHASFVWSDQRWQGVPLEGSVLYELHVGTFTPEGTFDSAVGRLDHLVELGVTAVELLPCNAYAGRWGWGYDGVGWYAVHDPYGGPDGLKRLVDACHARGLGVVMDVVYNHLGPAGNYLPEFGPYLTDGHLTPWGPAVNLDQPGSDEVRRYVVDNALMWLRDYHCDGLRLDAVHALLDDRATHLLQELSGAVADLGTTIGKPLFLVAESDRNDPRTVVPVPAEGLGMTAQWADDVHHAVHALVTGERQGYYGDFGSLPTLAKALTGAFVHDGCWSSFRERSHGRPVPPSVPGHRFVVFSQDHDQVGNRALGDRPAVADGLLRLSAALVLLSPYTPMLWMGEEWGATTPWCFFSDHDGELADAVRDGRREEFAAHGWASEDVPDPQDEATYRASQLDWDEVLEERGRGLFAWYRELIRLRRSHPELSDGDRSAVEVSYDEAAQWVVVRRGGIALLGNLAPQPQVLPVTGTVLLGDGSAVPDGTVVPAYDAVVVST